MKSARKRKGRQVSHIAPINRTMCNNLVVDNFKNFLDHATINRPIWYNLMKKRYQIKGNFENYVKKIRLKRKSPNET